MARPREFEIEEALQDAMNVFWEKGYGGASMPDLLEGMGIARGSLYKAYGDKKSLFLQALALYDREALQPAVELLRSSNEDAQASPIRQLFTSIVETVRRGDRRGCLLCNAAASAAAEDEDIGRMVASMLNRLNMAFEHALSPEACIDPSADTAFKSRADALTAAYIGLRVLSRSGASVRSIERAANGIIENT